MGHALHNIWHALAEDGTLIDVRPVSSHCPLEIVTREEERRIGQIDANGMAADDEASDRAVLEAVERGWFAELERRELEFNAYWDGFSDMEASIEDGERMIGVTPSIAELRRAHGALFPGGTNGVRIRARRTMMLAAYRKIEAPEPG